MLLFGYDGWGLDLDMGGDIVSEECEDEGSSILWWDVGSV